jgi:hypothetical protein
MNREFSLEIYSNGMIMHSRELPQLPVVTAEGVACNDPYGILGLDPSTVNDFGQDPRLGNRPSPCTRRGYYAQSMDSISIWCYIQ